MRKLAHEFIKAQFEKEGYELLSKIYVNQREKLKTVCPEGHFYEVCWSDWKQGRRCPICAIEKGASKRRKKRGFIVKSFNKEGYFLKPFEYRNNDQKLDYICPNGHEHSISWHNWNSGWRCPACHHEKLSIIFSGPNSHFWKGGISCEPYCDEWADKEYKLGILERDNHMCQNPACWKTTNRLTIHHIDYDKQNCRPWNLITLCRSCNSRANYERDWHSRFYKRIMKFKYNYKEV